MSSTLTTLRKEENRRRRDSIVDDKRDEKKKKNREINLRESFLDETENRLKINTVTFGYNKHQQQQFHYYIKDGEEFNYIKRIIDSRSDYSANVEAYKVRSHGRRLIFRFNHL